MAFATGYTCTVAMGVIEVYSSWSLREHSGSHTPQILLYLVYLIHFQTNKLSADFAAVVHG